MSLSYDEVRSIAAVAGLVIFIALFAGVLIYTFWPGNRARFEGASRIPLQDDADDSLVRGDNGH
jgi:cytochrome c oxidase cbb3-type subunit 4